MKFDKTFFINKSILLLFFSCCFMVSHAQAPQKIGYQSEIRNLSGVLVTNTVVGMKLSILKGAVNGTAIYVETHLPTTNNSGLVSLEIGQGNVLLGTFSTINWNNGPYFIKTETDPLGGSNYILNATSQFLSVPYAYYAGNGINSLSAIGDTVYLNNGNSFIIPDISAANIMQGGSCNLPNVFNDSITYGTLNDQDGHTYKTVQIGNQEWMAENLRTSKYRNGDPIDNLFNPTLWLAATSGGWTNYKYDSLYDCPSGKLYNFYAVADSRNLCPTGWHVPTEFDWDSLINFIDTSFINTAGGALKSIGAAIWQIPYWHFPNTGATNSTGFSALPGGDISLPYGDSDTGARWWSSTQGVFPNDIFAKYIELAPSTAYAGIHMTELEYGLSVRCIKD
jgi:uncharacterized protein (TIGR02145 family)